MNMSQKKSISPEILAEIKRLVAETYTANLKGFADRADLVQDAAIAFMTGTAETARDAVRLAFNLNREERFGSGAVVGFQYLSATVAEDESGNAITLADRLADTVADREHEVRGSDFTRADLIAAVAAVRDAKTVRAHGEANAARGRANLHRGVVNDDRILSEIEAVGGIHYGYAAKVARSLGIKPNAVYQAVFRAKNRTERGQHSSRD